jgi:hypothetical protein
MLGAGLRVALEVTARFRVIAQATASLYLPQVRVLFAQTVVAISGSKGAQASNSRCEPAPDNAGPSRLPSLHPDARRVPGFRTVFLSASGPRGECPLRHVTNLV